MFNRRQAALYYARRRRLSRLVLGNLTPWSTGLAVTKGQYVQNAGNGYQALGTGTTGATAPVQARGQQSDGTITWQYIDTAMFADMVFVAPSTPA